MFNRNIEKKILKNENKVNSGEQMSFKNNTKMMVVLM